MSRETNHVPWMAFLAIAAIILVIGLFDRFGGARIQSPERDAPAEIPGVLNSRRLLMGTEIEVTIWAAEKDSSRAMEALAGVFDELSRTERRISSWLPESETGKINRAAGPGPIPVSNEMERLLRRSLQWAKETGGAFDVTGGPLFELWENARASGSLPTQAEVDRGLALTGYEHLELRNGRLHIGMAGMRLGFGAIGKGFAADRAGAFLEAKGFPDFIINAGGDLLVRGRRGERPWHVAVRDPRHRGSFLAGLEAPDCAVATSGDYERYFMLEGKRYSHILDLRTGWPARHLSSVTVIAKSATDADALATALFVMESGAGIQLVEQLPDIEAIFVDDAGRISLSSGLRLEDKRLTVDWR